MVQGLCYRRCERNVTAFLTGLVHVDFIEAQSTSFIGGADLEYCVWKSSKA